MLAEGGGRRTKDDRLLTAAQVEQILKAQATIIKKTIAETIRTIMSS